MHINKAESIILLKNDSSVAYKFFIDVQYEIVKAYKEVKNELSKQKFNSSFDELTQEQQEEIKKIYPIKIIDK